LLVVSSSSTTPTSPSPSTATPLASKYATTSPTKAFAASQPDVSVIVSNYLNDSPADSDTIAALIAKGGMPGVHFQTEDLDATFEKLQSSGAEIVQEPTDQFWGTRDCAVRDPSGNMVRIDQASAT
jgi:catechol 2,3-dioxygenase-like lactoylglutathione lyase family enzyme